MIWDYQIVMKHKYNPDYKTVNLIDVNEILGFAKKEVKELEEEINEDKRIEQELLDFMKHVEKNSKQKIHFIGHEKKFGIHMLRFMFSNGGFMEVMVEKPLSINAHFLDAGSAAKFAKGLKKVLDRTLPDSPVKSMYIDSVKVSDGFGEETLNLSKWTIMHKITIHRTILVTVLAMTTFFLIESVKVLFHERIVEILNRHFFIISWAVGLIIGLLVEPLRTRIEHFVERHIEKIR